MEVKISDFEILTKTLFFEAGSTCNIKEVLYIGWVIRNRVEGKRWFGNTYKKVCLKKWHFSCWNGKTIKQIKKIKWDNSNNHFAWKMCRFVAAYIMESPAWHNPIPGATHYVEPTLACPSWARKMERLYPQLKLKHLFFKEK